MGREYDRARTSIIAGDIKESFRRSIYGVKTKGSSLALAAERLRRKDNKSWGKRKNFICRESEVRRNIRRVKCSGDEHGGEKASCGDKKARVSRKESKKRSYAIKDKRKRPRTSGIARDLQSTSSKIRRGVNRCE